MKGLPKKGAIFEDNAIKVNIKDEKLVKGYNVFLIATCTEGPSIVTRKVLWPLNIKSGLEETNDGKGFDSDIGKFAESIALDAAKREKARLAKL
jgi:hypothetical protein